MLQTLNSDEMSRGRIAPSAQFTRDLGERGGPSTSAKMLGEKLN